MWLSHFFAPWCNPITWRSAWLSEMLMHKYNVNRRETTHAFGTYPRYPIVPNISGSIQGVRYTRPHPNVTTTSMILGWGTSAASTNQLLEFPVGRCQTTGSPRWPFQSGTWNDTGGNSLSSHFQYCRRCCGAWVVSPIGGRRPLRCSPSNFLRQWWASIQQWCWSSPSNNGINCWTFWTNGSQIQPNKNEGHGLHTTTIRHKNMHSGI